MSIPVSTVVNVDITIGATFPARAGFGTLNIVTDEDTGPLNLSERIRTYNNIDGVAEDWGSDTEAYKAATSYFSQQPKPTRLKISRRFSEDQGAQLRGGVLADTAENLALFTAITDGSFAIEVQSPGTLYNLTALDFSTATSMVDVAAIIFAAFPGAAVPADFSYSQDRMVANNTGTLGATSVIQFLTPVSPGIGTDISGLLQMQDGQGMKFNGIDGETITASLDAIQNIDQDWYGLAFTKEVRDLVEINGEIAVPAAATWCEARVKIFVNTANSANVLNGSVDTDIISVLKNLNLRRVHSVYSSHVDQYPSCSVAGRAFTVNFSQPNSTITLKFKQLPGITAEVLTQNQKAVLDSKNGNALIIVGNSIMFAESYMANGVFFDEVHGVDWLQNALETNVFGYLLTRPTKVPYTNDGVAAIEQQMIRAFDEAGRNGLLAPGYTIDGVFLPFGYQITAIPVEEINQSDKEARHYPGLSFIALGAGAIHSVQINGIFER